MRVIQIIISINAYSIDFNCQLMQKVEKNEFVEWCNVNGSLYGTTYAELKRIESKGKIPIIEANV